MTKLTQETEDVVGRLRAAAVYDDMNAPLYLEAADRIDVLPDEIAAAIQKARDEIGANEQQRIAFAYAEAAMRSVFRASLRTTHRDI